MVFENLGVETADDTDNVWDLEWYHDMFFIMLNDISSSAVQTMPAKQSI